MTADPLFSRVKAGRCERVRAETTKPPVGLRSEPFTKSAKTVHTGANETREQVEQASNKDAAAGGVPAALAEAGIREPARSRLAALPHLTPAMVRDQASRCRREGKRGGMLIAELKAAQAEQVKQAETGTRRERASAWWADLADADRRRWADRVRETHGNSAPDGHESMPVWAWKLKQAEDRKDSACRSV